MAMDRTNGGSPLLSLDAVVIDTETTGLDPRKARVIELAAVRLSGGKLVADNSFRQLLRPAGETIPAMATRIHGIDNAAVAESPLFVDTWPRFKEFLGHAVVIGHTIGFDLAVLKRECDLAGSPWSRPRTLDTRLLAEIAAPELAGYTLEKLAAWLEVDVTARHSALGDAITTARIFLALIPRLRDLNVRTVAEAERACRTLTERLDDQVRIGWIEAVEAPARIDAERTMKRFDSYPYRHRNRDIMRMPALFATPDTPVSEALTRMTGEKVSSLYVCNPESDPSDVKPTETGIVTERDVLRAIDSLGAAALALPVGQIMSKPLASVPADAFVYRAIGRMNRLNTRHLGVVDEAGRVVGALSARDLLRLRATEAISLGDEIDDALDAHALSVAWGKLPRVAEALLAEGLSGRDLAEVVSSELGALSRQAAVIAERFMRDRGQGAPPSPYTLVVLGSAGRGESLLAMDQDNAVIFEHGEPGGSEDRWFAAFAARFADILHEVGVPYCKGGVMAKNAAWRGSVATWRDRIGHWITRSNPNDLLSVDIFFDLRAVHGDAGLASGIRQVAFVAAQGQTAFAKLLVEGVSIPKSLKPFGGIRTDEGRIDLKRAGLFGIVAAARALAIRYHVMDRSTSGRLVGVKAIVQVSQTDLDALAEAQGVFLDLIMAQQIEDIAHGTPPSNTVVVKRLSVRDRNRLRVALEAVTALDTLTRDLLFKD
jgi:DNA polymerase-3 subunit epsilon/CBS domain-containing protein